MELSSSAEVRGNDADHAERKLWLDYLARLTDRETNAGRVSGATSWALVGVLVAILIKCVPQLPFFITIPGIWSKAAVTVLLQSNVLFYLMSCLALLIYYCREQREGRFLPEMQRKARLLTDGIITISFLIVGFAHLAVAFLVALPMFVKIVLWTLGGWWILNVVYSIRKNIAAIRRARAHRIPVPVFSSHFVAPDWRAIVFSIACLILAILSAAGLFMFLRILNTSVPAEWVVLIAASTYFLAFCAVLFVLFVRSLSAYFRTTYSDLEQEVMMKGYDSATIRKEFALRALGPSVSEWLQEREAEMDESEKMLRFPGFA